MVKTGSDYNNVRLEAQNIAEEEADIVKPRWASS